MDWLVFRGIQVRSDIATIFSPSQRTKKLPPIELSIAVVEDTFPPEGRGRLLVMDDEAQVGEVPGLLRGHKQTAHHPPTGGSAAKSHSTIIMLSLILTRSRQEGEKDAERGQSALTWREA